MFVVKISVQLFCAGTLKRDRHIRFPGESGCLEFLKVNACERARATSFDVISPTRVLHFARRLFRVKSKNAPCGQDAFFSLVGNRCGSLLAGVKFDDELFVDDGIDFLACGDTDDAAVEIVFIDKKPIWNGNDLGEFDSALGEAGGFLIAFDGNNIAGLEIHRRNIGLESINGDMSVANHLACSAERLGEAHFLNDIVEASFEELEENLTGNTAAAAGNLKIAAELALQNPILVAELLFFSKGDRIIGLLAAGTLRSVLAWRVVLVLECFW